MARQIRLTRKRLEWAAPRNATLKGERLPPYSAATAAKYQAELDKLVQRMQKEYNTEVRRLFRTHADEESALAMDAPGAYRSGMIAADASLASQARMLFNSLGKKWAKIFGGRASSMTERMIDGASMASKRALGDSLKKISGGLTIPVPVLPGSSQERITAATAENVGLIRSIQQQYHERISQLVLRSASTGGNGAQEIFESIRHYDGLTEKRAKLIAVDQTRKITTALNVERAKSVGMRKWEWVHSGGSTEPRRLHVQYDGQIFDYDNPPVIDERTNERGFPGQLINCHPGDTLVKNFSPVHKLYRSFYSGELVSLVADNGVVLKATPNHPVLTMSGWKAIKDVNLGEYLVEAGQEGFGTLEANVKQADTEFVDLFESTSYFLGHDRAPVTHTGLEFHGDIADTEIQVIDIKGRLPDMVDPALSEGICKLILAWADDNSHTFTLGECAPAQLVMRSLGAPNSLVSSLGSALTLLKGGFAGADDARLALAAYLDSRLFQSSIYSGSGNSVSLGQLKLAESAGVLESNLLCGQFLAHCVNWFSLGYDEALSAQSLGEIVGVDAKFCGNGAQGSESIKEGFRVIEKSASEYSGHVYNLESRDNWYGANGIVTHNCRCTMAPILELGDAEDTQ